MSLYPDIELNWGGKSYSFTASMRWCAAMESQGMAPMRIAAQWQMGHAPYASVATLMASALKSVGADVDAEEIMLSLTYNREAVQEKVTLFLAGIIPQNPDSEEVAEGNEEAP